MKIGGKIRSLRQKQGIKLIELAQKSGIQLATLSRIEHSKMTGTLECHLQIARALGIDITDLYRDISREQESVEILSAEKTKDIFFHTQEASAEILVNNLTQKKMMPTLLKLNPAGKTSKEQATWGTEKFIYVLEGALEVHIDEKTYSLKKNHSLYFNAGLAHWFENKGKTLMRAVCVSTPVML